MISPSPSHPIRHETSPMKALSKRFVLLLLFATALVVSATGCNTAHGFGKDMEKAGEKIQEGTE